MRGIEEIKRDLRRRLTAKRYAHSLCVRRRAMELALLHGADYGRAGLAGLVHDVCHCERPEALLRYLRAHGARPDPLAMGHPQLWHAAAGAIYVREEYGIRDPQVLRAVRYHTTGRAGMSPLEQVVYLADLTGEDRDYPDAEKMRALSARSLREAMRASYLYTVDMLLRNEKTIVKDCWAGYNEYVSPEGED